MKPIVRDFMVGATVLAGLAVFLLGLMFFGELTFERRYEIKVRLVNAAGLSKASRVTMSGVSIGQVEATDILPPDIGGVPVMHLSWGAIRGMAKAARQSASRPRRSPSH